MGRSMVLYSYCLAGLSCVNHCFLGFTALTRCQQSPERVSAACRLRLLINRLWIPALLCTFYKGPSERAPVVGRADLSFSVKKRQSLKRWLHRRCPIQWCSRMGLSRATLGPWHSYGRVVRDGAFTISDVRR